MKDPGLDIMMDLHHQGEVEEEEETEKERLLNQTNVLESSD